MSNVTLTIGSRSFTVACAKGEEQRVAELGQMIDQKVAAIGAAGQSEGRMLLFAALMLADELHETQARLDNAAAPSAPPELAERLDALAIRLENLAESLEA